MHLEALTFLHNFHQLISERKHLLPYSNVCTDLIFTDQPNLVVNCGIHSSLNYKCHHQITHYKLNLNTESAFHPSEVDKMSTRYFWEFSCKK